jgi:pimeloyl-[acyl-carrier protein] methyl ester esterase
LSLGLDLLREEDLRGRLPDIRCPALWLFGTHDVLVPAAAAARIELLMPGARTEMIQGAGHAPHLSHPRETGSAIERFVTRLAEPDLDIDLTCN